MLSPAYDLTFYEYDPEKDPESYGVLLCDFNHGKPPMKPLYMGLGWYWYYHGTRYGAETLCLPTTHGWDSRFINGYPYITAIRTTEEERKLREPVFKEKIRPFIEDFNGVWDAYKTELLRMYTEAKRSRGLVEWQDIRKLSNHELLDFFLDFAYILNRKEGEIHFVMLVAACYLNGLFQQQWRELLGVEPTIDPRFARCTAGGELEHQAAMVARELWRLARRAVEMGLEGAFAADPRETLRELSASEKGRQWLDEYREFLLRDGWRCQRMHAYDTPAWIEDPSLALGEIRLLLPQETFAPDAERARVIREREATEAEVLAAVPGPRREAFRLLMRAARMAGYWSEDHSYYCDLYIGALGRWIVTEFGRRFAEAGCIDDPEDVHFLHPNEIRKAAIPMGRINLRPYVERRKKEWERNLTVEPAPFMGDISQAEAIIRSDPSLLVSAQHPIVREELKADLYGAAAAPGYVEGVARVIMTADGLAELKPGEILVAPGTSPAWMVAFNLIRGVVTDGGGAFSHAVIMAREYGLPCVAGCVEATTKIKTGQRIRVDGDRGVVYVLDG